MTHKPIREYPRDLRGRPLIPKEIFDNCHSDFKSKMQNGEYAMLGMDERGITCLYEVVIVS